MAFHILISSILLTMSHPMKMSFSKLIISEEGLVELETRIFLDDLTSHIEHTYRLRQADFSTLTTNGTKALQEYLITHLYLEQTGEKNIFLIKAVSLSKNKEALILQLTALHPVQMNQPLFLRNDLLCDGFAKQRNDILFQGQHYVCDIHRTGINLPID